MKILLLCDKKYWTKKMSRVRFHAMDAIVRNPMVDAIKDGPGFDGWTDCVASVNKHMPDFILWYKPLDMPRYNEITVPKAISYNEMWDVEWTTKEIKTSNSNLVICHHLNDIKQYPHLSDCATLVNASHCIEKAIFKDYNQPKNYDILLAGVISGEIYPLRTRFYNMLKAGKFSKFKTKILTHPGYRIENVDSQVINYAKELNSSKLVLTCTSKYKYALAKHSEVPACNSLLLADIPDERPDFFNRFVVNIDLNNTDKEIIDTISYWVSHDKEREERSILGMNLTHDNYTQEHYANRIIEYMTDYLATNR